MKRTWRLPYRHHYYPLISTLLMIVGLVIIVEGVERVNLAMITAVVAIYYFSNVLYALINKELNWPRLAELTLLAGLIEYLSTLYLI